LSYDQKLHRPQLDAPDRDYVRTALLRLYDVLQLGKRLTLKLAKIVETHHPSPLQVFVAEAPLQNELVSIEFKRPPKIPFVIFEGGDIIEISYEEYTVNKLEVAFVDWVLDNIIVDAESRRTGPETSVLDGYFGLTYIALFPSLREELKHELSSASGRGAEWLMEYIDELERVDSEFQQLRPSIDARELFDSDRRIDTLKLSLYGFPRSGVSTDIRVGFAQMVAEMKLKMEEWFATFKWSVDEDRNKVDDFELSIRNGAEALADAIDMAYAVVSNEAIYDAVREVLTGVNEAYIKALLAYKLLEV